MSVQPIRVPVVFDGISYRVALPSYVEIPGTYEPVIDGLTTPDGVLASADPTDDRLAKLTVMVLVPAEHLTAKGDAIDRATVREMYGTSTRVHPDDPRYDKFALDIL